MTAAPKPMIVSGHQPVYLPWLGLFHKMSLCDVFVFMDDVQYLSGDWNNRNQIKGAQGAFWLTIPVRRKASASPLLKDILIDDTHFGTRQDWQTTHLRALESSYRQAPYWARYGSWLEEIYRGTRWTHLAALCEQMILFFMNDLRITPRFVKASELSFTGRKSDLVLEHCTRLDAVMCVVGTHGRNYIQRSDFLSRDVSLVFQDYKHPEYTQRFGNFVPYMSIIDLLCNHGPASREILMSGNVQRAELDQWRTARGDAGVFGENE
jgi:hypothetical protein